MRQGFYTNYTHDTTLIGNSARVLISNLDTVPQVPICGRWKLDSAIVENSTSGHPHGATIDLAVKVKENSTPKVTDSGNSDVNSEQSPAKFPADHPPKQAGYLQPCAPCGIVTSSFSSAGSLSP